MWEQVFAELQVKHCYLPLVQITALITHASARARWAMLLPGLGQPLDFFFNDTATTEIYTKMVVGSVRCV